MANQQQQDLGHQKKCGRCLLQIQWSYSKKAYIDMDGSRHDTTCNYKPAPLLLQQQAELLSKQSQLSKNFEQEIENLVEQIMDLKLSHEHSDRLILQELRELNQNIRKAFGTRLFPLSAEGGEVQCHTTQ